MTKNIRKNRKRETRTKPDERKVKKTISLQLTPKDLCMMDTTMEATRCSKEDIFRAGMAYLLWEQAPVA